MSAPGTLVEGSNVEVTTSLGDVIKGNVTLVVPENGLVVISKDDEEIYLSLPSLKSVKVLTDAPENNNITNNNNAMKPKKLQEAELDQITQHELAMIQKRRLELESLGTGVSVRAQVIFDSIKKQLKCTWDDDVIVVLGAIYIKKPYRMQDVEGGDEMSRDYVRKTLEKIRQKNRFSDEEDITVDDF